MSRLSWPCQRVGLREEVAMWFRLNTLQWLIGVGIAEHVMDRQKHTHTHKAIIVLHQPLLITHTHKQHLYHPRGHTESTCVLKDKHFISSALLYLAISAQLSATVKVCVHVFACVCIYSPLYSPDWGTPLPVSSVCPSQYSRVVAYEEALTLFPHVADELVTTVLYPISGFPAFWCMAGIYVFSEACGLRCNLHDSTYTSGGSLIDIWDIFLSFFFFFNSSIH